MGAFILAGVVFLLTILCFFGSIALYMSYPAPSVQGDSSAPWIILITGSFVTAIIIASHWMPHIGW